MPKSHPTPKSIQRELEHAGKLLNQLAKTLTRIAADTAALGEAAAAKANVAPAGKSSSQGATAATYQLNRKTPSSKTAQGLPDTKGDFFAKHVKKRKQTASQIFQSVLASLNFEPSKEQSAILRNRLSVWLANAVKSGTQPLSSIGTGKERRYYRA